MILRKGRITKEKIRKIGAFTSSINVDYILAEYDIKQSIAHAKGLNRAGIIKKEDLNKIVSGLKKIEKKVVNTDYFKNKNYEDIHMAVEEELGEVGKKLHAGRSRNDQVACDMRMYLRDKVQEIAGGLDKIIESFKSKQKEYDAKNILLPFYTHLQKAQPIDLYTYLGVYIEWFKRDKQRFSQMIERINLLPLGSGAGACSNIKLDRKKIARELGFSGVIENPLDAVASRDYIIEFANACSVCGIHLSRLAEELIIFSTSEFSFVDIDENIADTSSIMPQKKNPDCIELIRAASGKVIGNSVNLMVVMKALPLSYNRDLQDDKAVFISAQALNEIVDIFPIILNNIHFNTDKMEEAALKGFTDACDFAEYLVLKGMDFRVAHQKIGALVNQGIKKGYKNLSDFSVEELKKNIPEVQEDVFEFIDMRNAVKRRLHQK